MGNELALTSNYSLTFDEMARAAQAMAQSGYFQDAKDASKAMVKVLAGQEMGLGPFASMTGIHIIKGKPVVGANLIATLVKNDPRYDYKVTHCGNDYATLDWYEVGKKIGVSSFTMDEAKNAGLAKKDNWRNYASDMLFARALTRGARRYAPGIFGGAPVYVPEELGAETDTDGYIEGEIVQEQSQPAPAPAPKPANGNDANGQNSMTLSEFRDWYLENGEQREYYQRSDNVKQNNIHLFQTLVKYFGEGVGISFRTRATADYEAQLDQHAIDSSE
jgi:hypothetical protein